MAKACGSEDFPEDVSDEEIFSRLLTLDLKRINGSR